MAFIALMGIVSCAALCTLAWFFYYIHKKEKETKAEA
jgi:hypothetical protein